MRKPPLIATLLLVVAFIAWGLYWFVGASAMQKSFIGWFADRRAEGWVAEASSIDTEGFPNRFDTTFEGVQLADPDTQVAWSTPLFQTLSLSYRPNHVITVFPKPQVFSTPDESITTSAERLRSSLDLRVAANLPVQELIVEMNDGVFSSSKGWTMALGHGQLAMRETPEASAAHSYDFAIEGSNLDPGEDFRARLGRPGGLPDLISSVKAQATAVFDLPWDRYVLERRRPQPRSIDLTSLTAAWGPMLLKASGNLTIDADGHPDGEIAVTAQKWRDMLALVEASGAITPDWIGPVTKALELAAGMKGDPETLDVTLSFRRGTSFIGPIPVGPAPVLHLP
jgi:hypothetical protein